MLLFAFIYAIAEIVIAAVAVIQFGYAIFSGKPNDKLTQFGQQLSLYAYHIFRFVTFNSEYKPFPFDDWSSLDNSLDTSPKTE